MGRIHWRIRIRLKCGSPRHQKGQGTGWKSKSHSFQKATNHIQVWECHWTLQKEHWKWELKGILSSKYDLQNMIFKFFKEKNVQTQNFVCNTYVIQVGTENEDIFQHSKSLTENFPMDVPQETTPRWTNKPMEEAVYSWKRETTAERAKGYWKSAGPGRNQAECRRRGRGPRRKVIRYKMSPCHYLSW